MRQRELPVILTPSRTQTALNCYREHWLAHREGLVKRGEEDGPALAFGTAMHAIAAEWWRSKLEHRPAECAVVASEQYLPEDAVHNHDVLLRLASAYCRIAQAGGTEHGEIVMAERRLEVTTPGGFILSFQCDRLTRVDGKLRMIDLKTVARPDMRWLKQWATDMQMRLYAWGIREFMKEPVEIQVEGCHKATGELILVPVELEDWMLDQAIATFDEVCRRDKEAIEGEADAVFGVYVPPEHNLSACYRYGRMCDYYEVCTAPPEQRSVILNVEYEVKEIDFF